MADGDRAPGRSRPAPPSVDALLRDPALADVVAVHGATAATAAVRAAVDEARAAWRDGRAIDERAIVERVHAWFAARGVRRARRVFNCTGTTLHTNLGRAPLAEPAIAAAVDAMRHPLALEYDLASGGRGDRDDLVEALVVELTGCEAATVVNNNAAAVLLALDTIAGTAARGPRREVLVSRGELIEIGGSFRVPDIMRRAGCRLVEVGTTNRTHARDYADAIGPKTALAMKAHASNYAIEGFVSAVGEAELATLAHEGGVPLMVDLGAGALVDLAAWGLPHEPTVRDTIATGADVVTFSGDKLLGGPQAGIVAGRREWIAKMKKNPLKRCLRCDKATLAALEATLALYREPERLVERLTALRLLVRSRDEIRGVAERARPAFAAALGTLATVTVEDCLSQIGSGAQPVDRLPSAALVVRSTAAKGRGLAAIEAGLRALPVPIVGRVHQGALWLDLRTVEDADAGALAASIAAFALR